MVGPMANPRLRSLLWWRRWAKKDWAIATVGFTVIAFALTLLSNSWRDEADSEISRPFLPNAAAFDFVDLTLLRNAKDRGFVWMGLPLATISGRDSDPAPTIGCFTLSSNSIPVPFLQGGGWCNSIESCSWRKGTILGSSNYMDRRVPFSGILSSHPSQNPEFFNWNKVKIRYCDGASFAGHPENEPKNGSGPFFRGQLIWEAVMDELLSIGLSKGKQALLSGCSAGGLATLIHCDDFRHLLPKDATVKCLADAGFFLDEEDVLQHRTMRSFYNDVAILQGLSKSLHKDCLLRMEPAKCLFPEEVIKHINTPVFLVNPAYDFWQVQHILIPEAADPHGYWRKCKLNIHNCNPSQLKTLHGFRDSMLKALTEFQKNTEGGMFINSCYIHCQTWITETWHSPTSPRINNKTIAESVGDWYFGRNAVKQIDCPFPCNPTCYHMNFTAFSRG